MTPVLFLLQGIVTMTTEKMMWAAENSSAKLLLIFRQIFAQY
jgi:hypothetical protein